MIWGYALAALAGALIAWLWQSSRHRRRRPAPGSQDELEVVLEEFVSGAEALLEELAERRASLHGLLGEADQRIAVLQDLGQAVPAAVVTAPAPAAPPPAAPQVTAPSVAETAPAPAVPTPSEETVRAAAALIAAAQARAVAEAESARAAADAESASAAAETAPASKARARFAKGSKRASQASRSRKAVAEEGGRNARHQEVLTLAQRGLDPAEIARITGRTTGEVQLILGLNRSLH